MCTSESGSAPFFGARSSGSVKQIGPEDDRGLPNVMTVERIQAACSSETPSSGRAGSFPGMVTRRGIS